MHLKYIFLLSGIVCCAACTTPASMQQTWTNPTAIDSTKMFQKLLVVALLKDAYTRRVAEDKLAAEVRPRGVVSYNYLPNYSTGFDTGLISNKLKQDGFDGIVIMRLITMSGNSSSSPGNYPSYYNTWYGYYTTTYPLYNISGSQQTNEIFNIETCVYSLNQDKLVWTGVTTAVNISDKGRMIDKVIETVKQRMKQQGFIK